MAPSNDEIRQALLDATYQVYQATPEETTVNKVRKQTEENLGIDDGFLTGDEWKKKSKDIIKERVVSFTYSHSYPISQTHIILRKNLWMDGLPRKRRKLVQTEKTRRPLA
jgi:hypothetical protein